MFRILIAGLSLVSIIWVASLYAILNYMSPYVFWTTAVVLLYLAIIISMLSIFTLLWIMVRYLFANITDVKAFLYNSMRQALLIWLISCISLILMHYMYFNILILALLLLIWILTELFYYWIKKIWENDL